MSRFSRMVVRVSVVVRMSGVCKPRKMEVGSSVVVGRLAILTVRMGNGRQLPGN
jgi:hypothetical protein